MAASLKMPPRDKCPGCFLAIYDDAAMQGWCTDCYPPEIDVLRRERDQQERFKWKANKRADKAERRCEQLEKALTEISLTTKGYPNGSREGQIAQKALSEQQMKGATASEDGT